MPRSKRSSNETCVSKTKRQKESQVSKCSVTIETQGNKYTVFTATNTFKKYVDRDEQRTVIGPDGMQRLCEDARVDPESIVMLILAWQCGAITMGYFTLDEWIKGTQSLNCDSVPKLRTAIPNLYKLITAPSDFKDMYIFAFDFCRTEKSKVVGLDLARPMLKLIFEGRWAAIDDLLLYLEESEYKVINRDQWMNILEFTQTIDLECNNYDIDGAWPVLLDNYVTWTLERKKLGPQS